VATAVFSITQPAEVVLYISVRDLFVLHLLALVVSFFDMGWGVWIGKRRKTCSWRIVSKSLSCALLALIARSLCRRHIDLLQRFFNYGW